MTILSSEEWRAIPDHEGYEASSAGRLRSLDRCTSEPNRHGGISYRHYRGRVLKLVIKPNGYLQTHLGKLCKIYVHHAVLLAFVGPRLGGMEARHLNGNRADNRPDNLRWGTWHDNYADRVTHGTDNRGTRHPRSTISEETAAQIKRLLRDGLGRDDVARAVGVTRSVVAGIQSLGNWSHVTI